MGRTEQSYRISVPDALRDEYDYAVATQDLAKVRAILLSSATAQQKEQIHLLLPDDLIAR